MATQAPDWVWTARQGPHHADPRLRGPPPPRHIVDERGHAAPPLVGKHYEYNAREKAGSLEQGGRRTANMHFSLSRGKETSALRSIV